MEEYIAPQKPAEVVSSPVEEDTMGLSLSDIVELFLHHWKWFVVSVIVCLICANINIRRSTPVFTRSAQIMIKEGGTKGAYSGNVDWFASLGVGSSGVSVQNELVAIQSPSMFVEVVKRLELNTRYQLEGRWYNKSLYGNTLPLSVHFPASESIQNDSHAGAFDIHFRKGEIILTNFRNGGNIDASKEYTVHPGQTVRTPLGMLKLQAGPALSEYISDDADYCIHVSHCDILTAAKATAAGLSAGFNGKENSIIDLVYTDTNTQRAEDILSTLIDAYNDAWVEDKNKMTLATNDFILERLKVIQSELNDVDGKISNFKSTNLVPDPTAMAGMYVSDASQASKRVTELGTQLYMAEYIRKIVASDKTKNNLLPLNTGIGASSLDGQIGDYNQKLLDRNRLMGNSNESNALVKELDNQLAQLRTALIASIDNQINYINTQLASSRQSESAAKSGIASSPEQARLLLGFDRQQKVKESLYIFLLQKREENELSLAFTAYNTRVIAPPMGSNAPVSPQGNRIYLIALAIGLAIPAAILYLLEITNTRVRGRKDLERVKAPFLGEIPDVSKQHKTGLRYWLLRTGLMKAKEVKETHRDIVIKHGSRNLINEAFRVVRTNLDFMQSADRTGGQCIMVTSSNPGSGKTFISGNLAASFALKGKRVLVLDFDMRRASASLYVNSPKTGVSAYLSGKTDDWKSLVVPLPDHENVYFLPVGTLPPNPAELLTGDRTNQLLTEIRKEYDLVFVDCPPVEVVADASIVAPLVDQTLFVVRVDLMEREMLSTIDKYYSQGKFNGLAVVLNGSLSAYGRYGYHRYGYRYGYGYGYLHGNGRGQAYGGGYNTED